MNQDLYEIEQNKIVEKFLNDRYLSIYNEAYEETQLELIIFSECNYKCDYCYIANHGDKLYPKIENENTWMILENLTKILNWMCDNDYFVKKLALFSAEFFMHNRWEDVFQRIYDACAKKKKICKFISIPTNMSFIRSEYITNRVELWIKKFNNIGIGVLLSGSIDGKYCDPLTRESKSALDKYDDEFYDKVFAFANKYKFGFHPMVSSKNIGEWKKNLEWFIEMQRKYDDGIKKNCTEHPFLLEVRNDDWDYNKIMCYADFLKFEFEYLLKNCYDDNTYWFSAMLLHVDIPKYNTNRQNTMLSIVPSGRLRCSMQTHMSIRVKYMDIVPCHRLCYDKFNYAKFREKNGKIVGMGAMNIPMMVKLTELNPMYSIPKCSDCRMSLFCANQCLGANYEANNDPFVCCKSVCDLYRMKYKTLKELYEEYHVFNNARRAVEGSVGEEDKIKYIDAMEEIILC